jgi:hypothetical protein
MTYEGELWWLPLSEEIRTNRFNQKRFYEFLVQPGQKKEAIRYAPGDQICAGCMLDELPFGAHGPGYNSEDFSKFFCSELVAAGLEKAGAVGT